MYWKTLLAITTQAVYKNQWYRHTTQMYGYKRKIKPCEFSLAGIDW